MISISLKYLSFNFIIGWFKNKFIEKEGTLVPSF
jgi:hypothetical protein